MNTYSRRVSLLFGLLAGMLLLGGAVYAYSGDERGESTVELNTPIPTATAGAPRPTFPPEPFTATCPDNPELPCQIVGSEITPTPPTPVPAPAPSPTRCAAIVLRQAGETYMVGGDGPKGTTPSPYEFVRDIGNGPERFVTNPYEYLRDSCTGEAYERDPATGREFPLRPVADSVILPGALPREFWPTGTPDPFATPYPTPTPTPVAS